MTTSTAAPDTKWNDLNRAVAELCVRIPVAAGVAGLAKELARIAPQLGFREVLARGGWYRLGGVVDGAGTRVADDLAQWAETELAAHGDDIHALADAHADQGFRATRLNGKTHYLVANTGPLAADFLQIEIEELQEVVSHALFAGETPGSLEELVDPPRVENAKAPALPLDVPFYALRRITDVAEFLQRMGLQKPEPQTVHRFFDAWQASSAGTPPSSAIIGWWPCASIATAFSSRYSRPGGGGERPAAEVRECLRCPGAGPEHGPAAFRPSGGLPDGLVLPYAHHQGRAARRRECRHRRRPGRLQLPAGARRESRQGLAASALRVLMAFHPRIRER
jgi:hypothetical protein